MGLASVACVMMTTMITSSTLAGVKGIAPYANTAESAATRCLGSHVIVAAYVGTVNTSLGSISAP